MGQWDTWDGLPAHCNTCITWTLLGGSTGQPACSLQHAHHHHMNTTQRVKGTLQMACLLTATHEHYRVGQWDTSDSLPAHCNTRIINITWTLQGGSMGQPACSLQHTHHHMNTAGWVNGAARLLTAAYITSHKHYRVGQWDTWDSRPAHCNTCIIIAWTLQGGSMGQPACSLQYT